MIDIGIIGLGGWGKNLLRNFQEQPEARIRTACDLVEGRRAAAAARYPGLNVTDQYRKILEDDEITAVVLATPGSTHFSLAREILASGKDIFIEKPMALSSRDCRKLLALAEENGRIIMVGHLLLYHPAIRRLKSELDSGALGRLYYLYSQRVNLGKIRRSENALWTFAPHDISVACYLVDRKPVSVSARGAAYVQKDICDVAFTTITFTGNVLAHLHVSWLDPHKIRKVTLVGSKKMVVFDDMERAESIRIYDKGVHDGMEYDTYGEYLHLRYGDVRIPRVEAGEPLKMETGHFLECVKERKKPLTDGANGLMVVSILEAAQRSLEEGRTVDLTD